MIEGVKRKNEAFLKSIESDFERKEFEAKISIVADKSGQDVDAVLAALRNKINGRLRDLEIDPETISSSLLKTFNRLKDKLPAELSEIGQASIEGFGAA